jgi:DNA-binding NarL/FixJ family response regulator
MPTRTSAQRVLVLEDVPLAQAVMCEVVDELYPGSAPVRCSTVKEALQALEAHHNGERSLDLALVDLSLPDGSGLSVVARCQSVSPPVPAIVVTIYDDDDHLFPALEAGAGGYIIKDSSVEQLRSQLQRIQDGEPPLSPAIARRILSRFQSHSSPSSPTSARPATPFPSSDTSAPALMTPRESEVLFHVAKGLTNPEIANALGVSRFTVADHVKEIYRKLSVSSRAEAALAAKQIGLI